MKELQTKEEYLESARKFNETMRENDRVQIKGVAFCKINRKWVDY